MSNRVKNGVIIAGAGIAITVLAANYFQSSRENGFGALQTSGLFLGIFLILLGATLPASVSSSNRTAIKVDRGQFIETVLIASFVMGFIVFFFIPVFLNPSNKIAYPNDYIRDTGRIGFDIRSIVIRLDNWYTDGVSPYNDNFIAYPPLALVVLSPFTRLEYPLYYKTIIVATLFCYTATALIISQWKMGHQSRFAVPLVFLAGIFSYGLQFELERGQFNLIAFTLCLIAIVIFHSLPQYRYTAYLFFALSVQMKVYPIFFIVMFIDDWRDWRGNLKRISGLLAANFVLLFVLGVDLFRDFIRAIASYQFAYDSNRHENLSIKGFIYSLSNGDIVAIPGATQSVLKQFSTTLEVFFFALLGICVIGIILRSYQLNFKGFNPFLLMACTISALIIPSVSNDYKLSLLIASTAILLANLQNTSERGRKVIFYALTFILTLAYWSTNYPYVLKPELLSRNFPALIIMLITLLPLFHLWTKDNATNSERSTTKNISA